MLKNIAIGLLILISISSIYLHKKWKKGIKSTVPFPYMFTETVNTNADNKAPIVIIGDQLGHRLGLNSEELAKMISKDLTSPIQIYNLAEKGQGLHRSLEILKSLTIPPLIVIYLGGTQEYTESRFDNDSIESIKKNFELYSKDKWHSLLMIAPQLAPFIYTSHPITELTKSIKIDDTKYSDELVMLRNELLFTIYKYELEELFDYIKNVNGYLISIIPPLNLDIPPKKSCDKTLDQAGLDRISEIQHLMKEKDYKLAYNLALDLKNIYNSNALAHFLHGQTAKALARPKEAQIALEKAMAFDCGLWRGSPVYNSILRQEAKKHSVVAFDFNGLVQKDWGKNELFLDETYPQAFYYQKMVSLLAGRIKRILKL